MELVGYVAPHSVELEEAVLGSMILEPNTIPAVIHVLTRQHFFRPEHETIFTSIEALFRSNEIIDLITISNHLRKKGELEMIGGPAYLANLTGKVSSSVNIEYHAALLNQYHVKRQAIRIGRELTNKAFMTDSDGFDIVGQTATEIFNLVNGSLKKTILSFGDELRRVINDLEKPFATDGLQCGFESVDTLLGGFQPSDLCIIAARPGMGKTAFMAAMLRHMAGNGVGVGVFSLEMSSQQIIKRMLSAEAQIPSNNFRTARFSETEWQRIHALPESYYRLPVQIDDSSGIQLTELNAKARQMHAKGAKIIFVDYLQLVKSSSRSREQEVAEVSRGLKNLAKDLSIPIVALAQLNREVEQRADKRPQLSDLRESGEIENSADSVSFLVRPEYYKLKEFEYKGNKMNTEGIAIFDVQKNRHGATGDLILHFHKELTTFLR